MKPIAFVLFTLTLCPGLFAQSVESETNAFCQIVTHEAAYEHKTVSIDAYAVAALHGFAVSLHNYECPEKGIALSAPERFMADNAFMSVMKALYPGYPNDDGYSDIEVHVAATGVFEIPGDRGTTTRTLNLQHIQNLTPAPRD